MLSRGNGGDGGCTWHKDGGAIAGPDVVERQYDRDQCALPLPVTTTSRQRSSRAGRFSCQRRQCEGSSRRSGDSSGEEEPCEVRQQGAESREQRAGSREQGLTDQPGRHHRRRPVPPPAPLAAARYAPAAPPRSNRPSTRRSAANTARSALLQAVVRRGWTAAQAAHHADEACGGQQGSFQINGRQLSG